MSQCSNCGTIVAPGGQCSGCGTYAYEAAGPKLETASHKVQSPGVLDVQASEAQLGGTAQRLTEQAMADQEPVRPPGQMIARGYQTNVSRTYRSPTRSFEVQYESDQKLAWWVTRIPVLLILGWFTVSYLVLEADWTFLSNVDLALHEGGHIFLRWGGDTIHALGGTIGQLLLPLLFTCYFWIWRRERFAGAVTLWWFGENFMYVERYIRDARTMELPLVGGTVHDWNYLLIKWGLLDRAREIADAVRLGGAIIMLGCMAALIWWTLRPTRSELRY